MSDLLSIAETAKTLGVSVDSVRRWEKKGLIKSQRSSQNYRLFNLAEVRRLLEKTSGKTSDNYYQILKAPTATSFTSIDLFAGAGGTALGLENAGFHHVLLNEFDKHAAASLRINRPNWNIDDRDVHDIDFSQYKGKVDLIEGGFPCQAFSYAGKKRGFDDTRGTLFHEFARAVRQTQPKIAIGENVRGLLTHDDGRTLKIMIMSLQGMGYKVAYRIMRSQYLDVPQKRERLVIIAVREDLKTPLLFPRERDYTIPLRDAIADVPAGAGQSYSAYKHSILSMVPQGGCWRDLPDNLQREYMKASYYQGGGKTGMARRLSWDEPSLTLTCNPAQKQTERCHPSETRPLNIREYARIQTFPDDWQFSGSVSAQYKQIGNAVPVNLGYYLGLAARHMLSGTSCADLIEVAPLPKFTPTHDKTAEEKKTVQQVLSVFAV